MTLAQDTFQIIAEPSRRVLLNALLDGEAPVSELVSISGMSQPVVSCRSKNFFISSSNLSKVYVLDHSLAFDALVL